MKRNHILNRRVKKSSTLRSWRDGGERSGGESGGSESCGRHHSVVELLPCQSLHCLPDLPSVRRFLVNCHVEFHRAMSFECMYVLKYSVWLFKKINFKTSIKLSLIQRGAKLWKA